MNECLRFKELADKKKEISNADLESIVNDEMQMTANNRYQLEHVQVLCGDKQISTATIVLTDQEQDRVSNLSMTGTGPVDATYKAIKALTVEDIKLLEFSVSSVTAGIDALGEVTVRCQDTTNGRVGTGRSANTDIIVASAQAYLNAINRLVSVRGNDLPKHPQFSTSIM
jgi:2-isopropylmalate synthase